MAREDTLLAHLSWRFHPRMEEVAVEALAYILNRYPASRGALAELLERAVPGMSLSAQPFETEASAPDGTRPDVLQKGDEGTERIFIEAKFYAGLTPNQPVSYLERLPNKPVSALVFLAPSERVEELWLELLRRVADGGMTHAKVRPNCAAIAGTGKHLLITNWTNLLDGMKEQLQDPGSGLADLRQLRGLVQFAKSGEEKAARPGEELVRRVTEMGKASGWLHTDGLNVTRRWYGFGRYACLGHRYQLGVWLGVNSDLDEEFGTPNLWLHCEKWGKDDQSWNARVRSELKAHVNPVKQEGEALWVAIVPKGRKGADGYAAALKGIAGILDDLVEPTPARADVLAEVTKRYQHRGSCSYGRRPRMIRSRGLHARQKADPAPEPDQPHEPEKK